MAEEKRKSLKDRIRDYFFDTVEVDKTVHEEKKDTIEQIIEDIQHKPVMGEITEPVVEKQQEVKSAEKSQQKFLDVSRPSQQQTQPQPKKQETVKRVWHPVDVISPIFGSSSSDNFVGYSASNTVDEEELYASTVVSPINGRETIRKVEEDVVDEKIASMTASDFINTVEDSQPAINGNVQINQVEMPQMKETSTYYQPVQHVEKVEKQPAKDDDLTQGYENLSLFD